MKYNLLQRADKSKDLNGFDRNRRFIFELTNRLEGLLTSNLGSTFFAHNYTILIRK